MATNKEKQRRKKIRDDLRAKERAETKATMPLSVEKLSALIKHLERRVSEHGCDHTLNESRAFLTKISLDHNEVVPWLIKHGGFCDCEVIGNVSEVLDFVTYRPPLVLLSTTTVTEQAPLEPEVDTGFGFTVTVMPPWKARRGRELEEGFLVFKFGRKNARYLRWFAQPPPVPPTAEEAQWIQQWRLRNDHLSEPDEWVLQRRYLGPDNQFSIVTVSNRVWTPVLSWVFDVDCPAWHATYETELSKATSDWRSLVELFESAQWK